MPENENNLFAISLLDFRLSKFTINILLEINKIAQNQELDSIFRKMNDHIIDCHASHRQHALKLQRKNKLTPTVST